MENLKSAQYIGFKLIDAGCFSHHLNNGGKQLKFPLLYAFINALHDFKKSLAGKNLFKEHFGETMEGYSRVRWWCSVKEMKQILKHFDELPEFFKRMSDEKISVESTKKLIEYNFLNLCF